MSCGLIRMALPSSSAAPANSLSTRTPRLSTRDATYSFATRFMPSRRAVTSMTSAARYSATISSRGYVLMQVADGGVVHRVVVAVDAADRELDLVAQLHVRLDALPARAGDLHERDVLDAQSAVVEQLAEGLHTMADALGVVESIDPEQDALRIAEARPDLRRPSSDVIAPRELHVRRCVDRDRKGLREGEAGAAVIVGDRDARRLRLVAQLTTHRAGEVAGIRDPLEADDICAEQSLQHLSAPRQLREEPVCRERYVVEVADGQVGPRLAEQLRHELQLVVLHPHDGALGGDFGRGIREPAIDPLIRLPPHPAVARRRRSRRGTAARSCRSRSPRSRARRLPRSGAPGRGSSRRSRTARCRGRAGRPIRPMRRRRCASPGRAQSPVRPETGPMSARHPLRSCGRPAAGWRRRRTRPSPRMLLSRGVFRLTVGVSMPWAGYSRDR